MLTYACGECGETFTEREDMDEHHANCDAIPDCARCGETFEEREEWFSHVYLGGCDEPNVIPEQPWQDRIHVRGKYVGSGGRLI